MHQNWGGILIRFAVAIVIISLVAARAVGAQLSGTVHSSDGHPTSDVLVLLFDTTTGMPIGPAGKPFFAAQDVVGATTGADGTFAIEVPDGAYNLTAQRWTGKTIPWTGSMGTFKALTQFGETVELLGHARAIKAPSPAATTINLTPTGKGTVIIDCKPESGNNDSLVMLSLKAPELDPVFGFVAWQGSFLEYMFAFNRMPKGRTTFTNVPDGAMHIAGFDNDSKPGFAATMTTVTAATPARVQLESIAGWSDARSAPPQPLVPLLEKIKTNKWHVSKLVPDVPNNWHREPGRLRDLLTGPNATRSIILPDNTSATLAHLLTVSAYLNLQR